MSSLTPRQKQIADLALLGLTNGEIAGALKVTPADVLAELETLYRDRGSGGLGPAPCSTELEFRNPLSTPRLEEDDG